MRLLPSAVVASALFSITSAASPQDTDITLTPGARAEVIAEIIAQRNPRGKFDRDMAKYYSGFGNMETLPPGNPVVIRRTPYAATFNNTKIFFGITPESCRSLRELGAVGNDVKRIIQGDNGNPLCLGRDMPRVHFSE